MSTEAAFRRMRDSSNEEESSKLNKKSKIIIGISLTSLVLFVIYLGLLGYGSFAAVSEYNDDIAPKLKKLGAIENTAVTTLKSLQTEINDFKKFEAFGYQKINNIEKQINYIIKTATAICNDIPECNVKIMKVLSSTNHHLPDR